jgi:hypothetical protein
MNKIIIKSTVLIGLAFVFLLASNNVQASTYHGTLTAGGSNTLTGDLGGGGLNGVLTSPPVATPGAGTYNSAQSVTLTASGATSIYYTTDGINTPSCSTGTLYSDSSPIAVGSSLEIQAISCYTGNASSTVASYLYAINQAAPSASPNYSPAPNYGGGGGGGGGSGVSMFSKGDANLDGHINISDFVILMADWGQTGTGNAADFNGDGKVDITDFVALMANWTN